MSGFTKLASSIVTSSVWVQDDHVLRVWIAMLATSDANGVVEASIPGFANLCRISLEQMEDAIKKLSDIDAYSRSPDYDGRRIEKIDGGWLILNYAKYRATRDPEERKRQVREAVARHRAKVNEVIHGKPPKAQAEAEAEAEAESKEGAVAPVDSGAWDRWIKYRKQIRKPLKPASILAAQKALAAFGSDQSAVVEQSIAQGWTGLFPLKEKPKAKGGSRKTFADYHDGGS